jgi:hypothetical protein
LISSPISGGGGPELWHIRKGRIAKFIWYWDRDRALADLDLEA